MEKIVQKIEELRMLFERLSSREKVLVLITAAAVVVFLVFIAIAVVNSSLGSLKDRLETKRDAYEQVNSLKNRYVDSKKEMERFRAEIGDSKNTLTQDVGQLAQENGIDLSQIVQSKGAVDKKANIRAVSVKVELNRVELPPLLKFLESIEKKNKLFFLDSITLRRRYDNPAQLDASFNVSTLVPLNQDE
ncbi:MAG: hypothetical protein C4523_15645 [Myxococcales bacterium]|nr:MAG: hypothetical protein C4523_15645 [Myxococcales bacterium]